ncbi:hypothetical protein evm_010109 [Chilo suppressalis]|nr:hypothetical protein evm_010109 [Chilo suppressalis]
MGLSRTTVKGVLNEDLGLRAYRRKTGHRLNADAFPNKNLAVVAEMSTMSADISGPSIPKIDSLPDLLLQSNEDTGDQKEGLHFANNLTRRHIMFRNNIMKIE